MAVNLASLLNTSADEVKRPIALPDGTYYGTVKSHQFIESSQKKTPGVEYTIELTHADPDVDLTVQGEDGKDVTLDPAGKSMRNTMWLSENALFMLTDFIKSCGIETGGRTLGELVPTPIGQPVMLNVVRTPLTNGEGFRNQIERMVGMATQ